MKIDCSKLSNKDDVVCLIAIFVVTWLLGFSVYLAIYHDNFISGFASATIVHKWKAWIYNPIDAFIDWLWAEDKAI